MYKFNNDESKKKNQSQNKSTPKRSNRNNDNGHASISMININKIVQKAERGNDNQTSPSNYQDRNRNKSFNEQISSNKTAQNYLGVKENNISMFNKQLEEEKPISFGGNSFDIPKQVSADPNIWTKEMIEDKLKKLEQMNEEKYEDEQPNIMAAKTQSNFSKEEFALKLKSHFDEENKSENNFEDDFPTEEIVSLNSSKIDKFDDEYLLQPQEMSELNVKSISGEENKNYKNLKKSNTLENFSLEDSSDKIISFNKPMTDISEEKTKTQEKKSENVVSFSKEEKSENVISFAKEGKAENIISFAKKGKAEDTISFSKEEKAEDILLVEEEEKLEDALLIDEDYKTENILSDKKEEIIKPSQELRKSDEEFFSEKRNDKPIPIKKKVAFNPDEVYIQNNSKNFDEIKIDSHLNIIESFCNNRGYVFDKNEKDLLTFLSGDNEGCYKKINKSEKSFLFISPAITKLLYTDVIMMLDEKYIQQAKTLLEELCYCSVDIGLSNKAFIKLKEVLKSENNDEKIKRVIYNMCKKEKEILNLIYDY